MAKKTNRGLGEFLFPRLTDAGVLDTFDYYLTFDGDTILRLAEEQADLGLSEEGPEAERFAAIAKLIRMYRAGTSKLIEIAYKEHRRTKARTPGKLHVIGGNGEG